jgi:hypothetical protein
MDKLPNIQDVYSGDIATKSKHNELNILLNQPPMAKWIKQHPIHNVGYIPIERIEYLLTKIFVNWHVEIKEIKLIANSVVVHIRLYYDDPVTNTEKWQDGAGAQPLQTDKGSGAIEFNNIKANAVQLAVPAAESYAIKDAAEKMGKLFGKDLNRDERINYDLSVIGNIEKNQIKKEVEEALKTYQDDEGREKIIERLLVAEGQSNELEVFKEIKNELIKSV